MPQIPTYIRQADWDKYIAIHSKGGWPEFIHNALNAPPRVIGVSTSNAKTVGKLIYDKPTKEEPFKTNFKKGTK